MRAVGRHAISPASQHRVLQEGTVQILEAHTKPDIMKFYKYVITTTFEEIRRRSLLAATQRRKINGGLATKRIVWSSQLRANGLRLRWRRGYLGDHRTNTEGWHFLTGQSRQNKQSCSNATRGSLVKPTRSVPDASLGLDFSWPFVAFQSRRGLAVGGRRGLAIRSTSK